MGRLLFGLAAFGLGLYNAAFYWVDPIWRNLAYLLIMVLLYGTAQVVLLIQEYKQIDRIREEMKNARKYQESSTEIARAIRADRRVVMSTEHRGTFPDVGESRSRQPGEGFHQDLWRQLGDRFQW